MGRSKDAVMVIKTDVDMAELEKMTPTLIENSTTVQFFLDKSELMQQVGRIQGIDFTRRVGDIAIAKIFDEIKLSKKYKDLPYIDENGNTRVSGSLDDFCRAFLKKSYNRCLELSQNMHLLGEELYESTQKIGFRARDYAALRALPEDEQVIIKQAIDTQSRDAVIEMLEDMAVRHAAQKAELTKERDDERADRVATEGVLAGKNKKIDSLETALQRKKTETPAEEWAWGPARRDLLDTCEAITATVGSTLRRALVGIQNQADAEGGLPADIDALQGDALTSIARALVQLQKEFKIPINLSTTLIAPFERGAKPTDAAN